MKITIMKKILILVVLSLSFASCSLDEGEQFNLELVPISHVEMPTAFRVDSITQIPVSYLRPTSCHFFANFYYNSVGNNRTVAVFCSKSAATECIPNSAGNEYELTVPLSFKPKEIGTYQFRFWTGVDEEGIDQYIEYEAIVNH